MHANLSVSMGGRVAEELIFGHDKVSSGASSDIQYATSLARNMVTKWGMSEKLGPLQYEEQGEGYLGYGANQRVLMSDETSKLIDSEIRAWSIAPMPRRPKSSRPKRRSCTCWPARCSNTRR